jgi:hypothetical protein
VYCAKLNNNHVAATQYLNRLPIFGHNLIVIYLLA